MENKTRIGILKEITLRCTEEFDITGGDERMRLSLIGNLVVDSIGMVEVCSKLDELVEDNVNAGDVVLSALRTIRKIEEEYGRIDWLGSYMSQYISKLPNCLKEKNREEYENFIKYFEVTEK